MARLLFQEKMFRGVQTTKGDVPRHRRHRSCHGPQNLPTADDTASKKSATSKQHPDGPVAAADAAAFRGTNQTAAFC